MPKTPAALLKYPHHCKVCGHDWNSRTDKRPRTCPACQSTRWEFGELPAPNLGQVFNDVIIDIQVRELREVVTLLNDRIERLLSQKGKPASPSV